MREIKLVFVTIFLLLSAVSATPLYAQSNPVIEGIADAGAINFNGKYYLAGVSTLGGFYVSEDLIKWTGPVHVFSMNNDWTKGKPFGDNQIHAADIHYFNGKFHFYWSVNFWGQKNMTVHIGHAVSDNILGPYVEPNKKTWFDNRIDPNLFMDRDSSFYFYSVKFTDGNTIWGQPMKDPWTLTGEPRYIFNSLPETWERYDNNVNEGPWVMTYRSKYYMMYNANHSANLYGNYALGVSEADSPLGFNSGNKYAQPVVQQNLTDDPGEMRYYFTASADAFSNWKYTFDRPSDKWIYSNLPDSGWKSGDKGFASQPVKGSALIRQQTEWNSDDIWIRKKFTLHPAPTSNLQLLVNHAGPTEIYIDGELVYKGEKTNYSTISLKPEIIQKLKTGNNLIAVHSRKGNRFANVDVDLVDPLTKSGDDILLNPGQPNILRGPNGMEWWLIYFGIKNGGKRGQFVNRVLFNDHELTVDGPTGSKTPGYHPNPALPVFGDGFETNAGVDAKWNIRGGTWHTQNGELKQTDSMHKTIALIKSHKAGNYLFKTGVKNDSQEKGSVGIVAFYADSANSLEVGIDSKAGEWYAKLVSGGVISVAKNKLSGEFNFSVYHSLSVYKNDKYFDVGIDDYPAPGNSRIASSFVGQGLPGLFTENSSAAFDAAIYTPGFDEYNTGITGWGKPISGEKSTGTWAISDSGISQTGNDSFAAFKGDLLAQYEFGTQVYNSTHQNKGTAGIYLVYSDKKNYLEAGLNFESGKIEISGKIKGADAIHTELPLKRKVCKYPDPKHGDGLMKYYPLKKSTRISALEIVKSVYDSKVFGINPFDSLKISYLYNGDWFPIDFKVVQRENQAVNKITFDNVTADAIRLVSTGADNGIPVYKLYVTEEQTSDYNLRAVKLKDRVILFLDGRQIAEIKGSWPASQVGLFGKNMAASYNGLLLYEK